MNRQRNCATFSLEPKIIWEMRFDGSKTISKKLADGENPAAAV